MCPDFDKVTYAKFALVHLFLKLTLCFIFQEVILESNTVPDAAPRKPAPSFVDTMMQLADEKARAAPATSYTITSNLVVQSSQPILKGKEQLPRPYDTSPVSSALLQSSN